MTRRALLKGAPGLSLAAATLLRGETAKDRGKRLIDQTVEGLGGDAFRNMRTRTEIGRASSFYREQLTGFAVAHLYTKYLEPDQSTAIHQFQRQVFGKHLEDAVIFTRSEAYEVTYRGARPLADDKVTQYHESTLHDIFYILRERLSEPGMEFEGSGIDVVENQPVETIEIYDSENRHVTVWVNSDSFVPVKQRFYRWDPTINDRHEEVTRYTKYRLTGGVMWPFEITRDRDGAIVFEMNSEHVTLNDSLPESMFELPNGIKILKK